MTSMTGWRTLALLPTVPWRKVAVMRAYSSRRVVADATSFMAPKLGLASGKKSWDVYGTVMALNALAHDTMIYERPTRVKPERSPATRGRAAYVQQEFYEPVAYVSVFSDKGYAPARSNGWQ